MPKCIFVNDPYDWTGDQPLRHPWSKTVIYETHIRGFTIQPKSGVEHPGTYRGMMEKDSLSQIPGRDGGGESFPLQEFNENSVTRRKFRKQATGWEGLLGLRFRGVLCAKSFLCSSGGLGQQKLEFKEMVGLSQG